MKYNLTDLSDQEFGTIWAALGELPAKVTFTTMVKIKGQVEVQEAAELAKSKLVPVASIPDPTVSGEQKA